MYGRSFWCLNSKIYARNAQSQPFNFQTLENHHIFKIAFSGWLTISRSILTLHIPTYLKQLEIISGVCRTSSILVTMSTWGVMSCQTVPIFPQTLNKKMGGGSLFWNLLTNDAWAGVKGDILRIKKLVFFGTCSFLLQSNG